ncbi:MAG: type II toxin-antitoxin system YoeB family toxin [Halopseudomonas sp.]
MFWQNQDVKAIKRFSRLIGDIQCLPLDGIGKSEAVKENLYGF